MAKAKKSWGVEFVDLKLTPDNRSELEAFVKKSDQTLFDWVDQLIQEGLRMTVVLDAFHDCVIVSLIGTEDAPHNSGLCLTSRAASFEEAAWIAVYKHFSIFQGGQWDATIAGSAHWG